MTQPNSELVRTSQRTIIGTQSISNTRILPLSVIPVETNKGVGRTMSYVQKWPSDSKLSYRRSISGNCSFGNAVGFLNETIKAKIYVHLRRGTLINAIYITIIASVNSFSHEAEYPLITNSINSRYTLRPLTS